MKKILLIFGILIIAANLTFGYILSSYLWHTATVTSIALSIQVIMLLLVSIVNMKDAFRASLNILFPLFAIIQFIALQFVPEDGYDSMYYVAAIGILLLQILLLLVVNHISSKIN